MGLCVKHKVVLWRLPYQPEVRACSNRLTVYSDKKPPPHKPAELTTRSRNSASHEICSLKACKQPATHSSSAVSHVQCALWLSGTKRPYWHSGHFHLFEQHGFWRNLPDASLNTPWQAVSQLRQLEPDTISDVAAFSVKCCISWAEHGRLEKTFERKGCVCAPHSKRMSQV